MRNDQRLDQRLKALNASVKVRRRGLGFNPWRYDLDLLDLSANGMALASPDFKLSQLQKIDFELSTAGLITTGCAVVCYTGNSANKQRYGLLFIETDQNFDSFFTGEVFSSNDMTRLGEEIAEQYMYQRHGDDDILLRIQHQRMIDAVNTLANRLGQMGLLVKDEWGNTMRPRDSIKIGSDGGLSLPMLKAGSTNTIRAHLQIINTVGEGDVHYEIDDGQIFSNIVDLLNYLCQAFDKISAA